MSQGTLIAGAVILSFIIWATLQNHLSAYLGDLGLGSGGGGGMFGSLLPGFGASGSPGLTGGGLLGNIPSIGTANTLYPGLAF